MCDTLSVFLCFFFPLLKDTVRAERANSSVFSQGSCLLQLPHCRAITPLRDADPRRLCESILTQPFNLAGWSKELYVDKTGIFSLTLKGNLTVFKGHKQRILPKTKVLVGWKGSNHLQHHTLVHQKEFS